MISWSLAQKRLIDYLPKFYKTLKPLQYKAFKNFPKEAKTVVNKGFQNYTILT